MGDLFGTWVPDGYIERVLGEVGANLDWFSFFLTKNPERLARITFLRNCPVGITLTGDEAGEAGRPDAEKQRQVYATWAQPLGGVRHRGERHDASR